MKGLLDLLLMGISVLFQLTLSSRLEVMGVGLDLVMVFLCSIAILQGPVYGGVSGLLAGLVLDGIFGHVGFYSAIYLAVGLGAGLLNERMRFDQWVFPFFCFLLCWFVKDGYASLVFFIGDALVAWNQTLLKVLIGAAVNGLVFLAVHFLLGRLHRWEVLQAPLFRIGRW